MATEDYICPNIECRYHSSRPFPICPKCGHPNTFVTKNDMRLRGCIGGTLALAVGGFLLLIAVFMSVVVANKHTAIRVNDVAALLLLYGLGAVFFIGGIFFGVWCGTAFMKSFVSFG